jgi:hypothetical protein
MLWKQAAPRRRCEATTIPRDLNTDRFSTFYTLDYFVMMYDLIMELDIQGRINKPNDNFPQYIMTTSINRGIKD